MKRRRRIAKLRRLWRALSYLGPPCWRVVSDLARAVVWSLRRAWNES